MRFDPRDKNDFPIAVFGGRGGGAVAAQVALDLAASGEGPRLLGFLNDSMQPGEQLLGHPALGAFEAWKDLPENVRFIAPLHKAGEMVERAATVRRLGVPPERWCRLVDPRANVATDVAIGAGSLVSGPCALQPGVVIGEHVAIRSGAAIAHDSVLEDSVFIGLNAVVCGYGRIGEGAHISPGAVIRDGVRVGAFAVVGLGAVVVRDVPEGAVVVGNPARPIGRIDD